MLVYGHGHHADAHMLAYAHTAHTSREIVGLHEDECPPLRKGRLTNIDEDDSARDNSGSIYGCQAVPETKLLFAFASRLG